MSRSTATVDLDAIGHNVAALASLAPNALTCAVVKANGYGHGAVEVATQALLSGASWLAVARVQEAFELRESGINVPILLLAEPDTTEISRALALGVRFVVYRTDTINHLAISARRIGGTPVRLHLKIDTGMSRVGCTPDEALTMTRRIHEHDELVHEGTMTHLAVADEPDNATTIEQLDRFDGVLDAFRSAGFDPGIRHAANSAGTMAHTRSHYDMVRVGIATYGLAPSKATADLAPLRPALTWTTTVTHRRRVEPGTKVSYGHRHQVQQATTLATIPVGYADGLRRDYGLLGGEVLIGGRRCPIVGTITMDQCVVDCGPDAAVAVGDDVIIIGSDEGVSITADDVADRLGTINYEVVCAISGRVDRDHVSAS